MTSAYPMPLEDLTSRVRALTDERGERPSIRAVMDKFNVGAKKARAALAALDETDAENHPAIERRLHSVPTTDTTVPFLPAQQVTTVVDTQAVTVIPASRLGWLRNRSQVRRWPIVLIALGAFVSIWGGWVELGKLTGFGEITPLPGIADGWTINSAITLPLGMEAYAALALQVWLSGRTRSDKARSFAKWSALGALVLGAGGQVAYHLMKAAGMAVAPWQITTVVSCLPVVVLGFGAALVHLMTDTPEPEEVH